MQRRRLVSLEEKCRAAKDRTRQKKLAYRREYYRDHRDALNAARAAQRHKGHLEEMHRRWEKEVGAVTYIRDIDMNVRLFNILRRHGIYSVEDLASMTEEEFAEFRGVGAETLCEANRVLEAHGLRFKIGVSTELSILKKRVKALEEQLKQMRFERCSSGHDTLKPLLTIEEAAQLLGRSEKSTRDLCYSGEIKSAKLGGRRYIDREALYRSLGLAR